MTPPIVWTIAGSDPSGGAGIQADLKTMNRLEVHGCSVITALIAQNTRQVARIDYPAPELIGEQLQVLHDDLPAAVIKIGMLGNRQITAQVASFLDAHGAFVVFDPVLAATSGAILTESSAVDVIIKKLLPRIDLLTPNIPEAGMLTGRSIRTPADAEAAAADLLSMGVRRVLLKGGHRDGLFCQDYYTDGDTCAWLTSVRVDTDTTHGSGCILSSAIASCLALGYAPLDAVVIGKTYVQQAIREGWPVGAGRGIPHFAGWPSDPADFPWMTQTAEQGRQRLCFPECGPTPLGLYPLVEDARSVETLAALGVTTIQLRVKQPPSEAVEAEIIAAIHAARKYQARLFINDYWAWAIKHGAYGVHLGQEDLADADLAAISEAGLRLGTSTHSYAELARVTALQPSYVAIGTVFPSPSKPHLA
ncbi:MAG: bifunctional hydroxymethylpyrimidine kinase/phosphomethylpyrimidine kinase, partial [Spartobacteria bacterium]|nr:bifunctional hydroxymethylpyrimidine kinase/phosphomethylpyrimidine kinase [Spartobacteria bacterium]